MQSNQGDAAGLHVAIIMDGNGRWATRRGLPRVAGHRAGAAAVRRVVEAAPTLGVGTLTLFAFSADNWQRPNYEVSMLMRLLREYIQSEVQRCIDHGIRLSFIGRRDRLSEAVRHAASAAEAATEHGRSMHLRIALDYSARDAMLAAAARLAACTAPTREEFAAALGEVTHSGGPTPDVGRLIRTSGEQRLSDFLLWECAYAEFYFTDRMWPDFEVADLELALKEFRSRERRFGRVVHAAVG
jgi:undecaprenyl diphosphate synthase